LLREEIERAVRSRIRARAGTDATATVEDAVQMLLRLVDGAELVSTRAWRRAAGVEPD
jgi:hypothetical protein